jgi:hypothetical protein
MPKWITDRIGACLVGLLIFSLLLTITGFIASYDARRRMDAFTSDGRSVSGMITNKYIRDVTRDQAYWVYVHSVSRAQTYMVDVSFQTEDGRFHYGSGDVSNAIYDLSEVGSSIRVTYVRSNPDWFYVADNAPTYRDVAIFADMFRYAGTGSLLILILLGAFVFWTPVGGTPAGESATATGSGEGSFRSPRQQPRAGFGKRPGL